MKEAWFGWLELINIVIAVINGITVPVLLWIVSVLRRDMRSGLATQPDLDAQDVKVTALETRVSLVENDMKYRPGHGEVSQVNASLAALSSEVKSLRTAMARIEDYLLNGSRT